MSRGQWGNGFRRWLRDLPDEVARSAAAGRPITCPDPGSEHGRALLRTLGVRIAPAERK